MSLKVDLKKNVGQQQTNRLPFVEQSQETCLQTAVNGQ